MIEAMGLLRSDVYIGNIMNWCLETPNDIGIRLPTQEEMSLCVVFVLFIGQVEIVQPMMVVALEATAVHGLLRYDCKAACEIVAGRGLFLPNSFAGYLPFLLFVEQSNDCTEAYFP